MKALAALVIVVAGAVGGFAVYAFGWRDDESDSRTGSLSANGSRIFTLRQGDVVRVPATATRCEASQEGGFPNLFCVRSHSGRYQVVFYKDSVQIYDLKRRGEPMAPTFVVPAEMSHASAGATAWAPCPRPPEHADLRRFRVSGGETCAHGRRVLDYAAFGHEGGCCPSRYLGYTCHDHPGGLERNSSGGSSYTYDDYLCTRGGRRAAWSVVSH